MQVRQGNPLFAKRPRGESRWNELGHHLRSAATHIALLGVLLLAPTAARADVITVTTTQPGVNTDAFCSLQEAIYSANFDANTFVDPGLLGQGPITVACAPGNGDDVIVARRAEGAASHSPEEMAAVEAEADLPARAVGLA